VRDRPRPASRNRCAPARPRPPQHKPETCIDSGSIAISSLPSWERQSGGPHTASRATASPQIARQAGGAAGTPPPFPDCNHCARLPSRWRHSAAGVSQRPRHARRSPRPTRSAWCVPGTYHAHPGRRDPSTGFRPVSPISRRFTTGGAEPAAANVPGTHDDPLAPPDPRGACRGRTTLTQAAAIPQPASSRFPLSDAGFQPAVRNRRLAVNDAPPGIAEPQLGKACPQTSPARTTPILPHPIRVVRAGDVPLTQAAAIPLSIAGFPYQTPVSNRRCGCAARQREPAPPRRIAEPQLGKPRPLPQAPAHDEHQSVASTNPL